MRRALIISYHLQPDPSIGGRRPASFVRSLRDAGWHVTCVSHFHPDMKAYWQKVGQVDVVGLREPLKISDTLVRFYKGLRHRNNGIGHGAEKSEPTSELVVNETAVPANEGFSEKLERYFHAVSWFVDRQKLWSLKAILVAIRIRISGRVDLVISSGPPMSPHVAATIASEIHGAPHVIDFRDPWIGNFERSWDRRTVFLEKMDEAVYRWCVRKASAITSTSSAISELVRRHVPDARAALEVVMNGFDSPAVAAKSRRTGILHLVYAGTLYFNRNPFPFLEAVDELLVSGRVAAGQVCVTFAGDCASWGGIDVAQWAARRRVGAVLKLPGLLPQREVTELLQSADVLINFAQNQPLQIPAKTFEYLGSGIEMLALTEPDSATALVVRQSGGGLCVDLNDRTALIEALFELFRRYVIEGTGYKIDLERVQMFSRSAQNAKLLALVSGLESSKIAP